MNCKDRLAHLGFSIIRKGTSYICWGVLMLIISVNPEIRGGSAEAQQGADTIEQIAVQGNQRIEPATVRTYLSVREGDFFEPVDIDRSLKNLFATGLFADVSIARQGNILIVRVVENPIINRISIEGNKSLEDDELFPEMQLRPRVVYTRTKVQQDVQRILDLYRRSGRFAVTVDPNAIELPQNRIDLVFEINEGDQTYVRKINFIGNKEYSDGELRDEVLTTEERWWRFLTSNDTYDPDRMTFDRELLRRFYLSNGYADFEVVSAVAELAPDRESFYITFTLREGPRYRFDNVAVDVAIPDFSPDLLTDSIIPKKGSWYNADEIEETINNITDAVGAYGYAFMDIRPRIFTKAENKTINVIFDVQEGPRVFVERVSIKGNVRTLDDVIRREFLLVEGDAFNTAKLRRSRERLQNLGFFAEVEVDNEPSEVFPDRTIVNVEVEEQSTGELQFGIGFSSGYGALFDVGIRERNLLGKGQDLRLNFSIAEQRTQIDLSFTEPYFLKRRLGAGVDLFATRQDFQREASFDSATFGGSLRLGFNYNEYIFQRVSYLLSATKLEGISRFASQFVREQQGTSITSQISQTFAIDRRDNVIDPTGGYFLSLSSDLAGLGGTEKFIRANFGAGYYKELWDGWVLSTTANFGYIVGLGEDIKIYQRYQLGGNNLRGFRDYGASPRDGLTGDALGGDWIGVGEVEIEIPIGVPDEIGIQPKLFTDFGTVGSPADIDRGRRNTILQSQKIRWSAGVGIEWESPVGPINIDWAHVISKADFDITESFRVNFGQRF